MKQLAAATSSRPPSTAAIDESGRGDDDRDNAEEAVFWELSEQHDKAEDGLLAGALEEHTVHDSIGPVCLFPVGLAAPQVVPRVIGLNH